MSTSDLITYGFIFLVVAWGVSKIGFDHKHLWHSFKFIVVLVVILLLCVVGYTIATQDSGLIGTQIGHIFGNVHGG